MRNDPKKNASAMTKPMGLPLSRAAEEKGQGSRPTIPITKPSLIRTRQLSKGAITVEFDLSAPESQLLERLLKDHRSKLAQDPGAASEEESQVVEKLLRKLTHPMRGGVDQSDTALLSDVGESIAPEIPDDKRKP